VRQVEHRLLQHAAFAEQERHEQTTAASVAVEEWMNGFELRVRQSDLDE
jgi:hypothetical protein